jgi:hypothetical protein
VIQREEEELSEKEGGTGRQDKGKQEKTGEGTTGTEKDECFPEKTGRRKEVHQRKKIKKKNKRKDGEKKGAMRWRE